MTIPAVVFGFCLAALLGLVLVPATRRIALARGIVDPPGRDKIHRSSCPHVGGVALFLAFAGASAALLFAFPQLPADARQLLLVLGPAGLLVAGSGLVDDLVGLRPWQKLLAQGLAIAVLQASVDLLGLGQVAGGLPTLLAIGLGVAWVLGLTNAMNLLDGLDGLAAGLASCIAGSFLVLALLAGDPTSAIVAALVLAVSMAFLRDNAHPARIFMGDTGSLFLGFALAVVGLRLFWAEPTLPRFLGLGLVAWVAVIDASFAVGRRLYRRQSIFRPDHGHLHHRLLGAGLSPALATRCLCGLGLLAAVAGLQVARGQHGLLWATALLLANLPLAWALGGRAATARARRSGSAHEKLHGPALSQDRAA